VYICQHQGVTFLLGDCSETEADIAIKVHGFHGKYVRNCCLVLLEKVTTGDQTSLLSVLKLIVILVQQHHVHDGPNSLCNHCCHLW